MPQVLDHIKAATGEIVKCVVLSIGDWNMDANDTVAVAHSLSTKYKNVFSVACIIRDDGDTIYSPFGYLAAGAGGLLELGYQNLSAASITLVRRTTGAFDGVNYDSTSYNRGKVIIWYLE